MGVGARPVDETSAGRPAAFLEGLAFPEAPRWHEERLWFSDMGLGAVFSADLDGTVERIVDVEGRPGGLGWLPDGRMVIVSMRDRRVLCEDAPGSRQLKELARLDELASHDCNDLLVDPRGNAYVGNFGFDLAAGDEPRPAVLARIGVDGEVSVAAQDLLFPNGMVLTPDGTLVVAESFGHRLTAFDLSEDGALAGRRLFADLPGVTPDGICLDEDGAVWVACTQGGALLRVAPGGEILDRISSGSTGAYACMLGGPDGRTLFVCTAQTGDPELAARPRTGAIVAIEVESPRAGLP